MSAYTEFRLISRARLAGCLILGTGGQLLTGFVELKILFTKA